VQPKSYSETIDWLFQRFPSYQNIGASAYKPGLENILSLCKAFGNPQNQLQFVHIAGSNGKGSTSSILASFLIENQLTTGLFTSPHLVDFRERIRVNGEMISEAEVIDFCEKINQINLDFEPSFFEITFVMALDYFSKQNCEICVIETGLGGRLDATNVITPLLSIITTISLEHTNFLGNDLTSIAFEKAGIIKKNVPVVIGHKNEITFPVFLEKARLENAEMRFATDHFFPTPDNFPLLGDYQRQNYQTVCSGIEILKNHFSMLSMDKMAKALKNLQFNTGFQGRLQIMEENPRVLFDVSHNAEGIKATLDFLESAGTSLKIVYGSSTDKNFDEIFPLFPLKHTYFFTEFENVRSAGIEILKEKAAKRQLNATFFKNPSNALAEAKHLANNTETILVFGSFFLLHDFLK
jgi:dihydrofolate synthase / folylpolyglutamate synthase